MAAFAEVVEVASLKVGSYELNGDLTSLLTDCHFECLVSEDHCCSTFAMDTEVIGVGHHLDHNSVVVSWYY